MLSSGFISLINSLTNEEIVELCLHDPNFLNNFCYMLSLESQLLRESKKNFA